MPVTFSINPGLSAPIYRQITDQVRLAVTTGQLAVGEQLPSVRALAEDLVVNPNTVARAYGDLLREGLLESRAGRGMFITHKRKVYSKAESWRRLQPLLSALIGEAMILDYTPAELREAFEEELHKWKHPQGGNPRDE